MSNDFTPVIPPDQKGPLFALRVRKDPLAYFAKMMLRKEQASWIKLDGIPVLVLNDATGIEHVLQTAANKYEKSQFTRKPLSRILGRGIFLTEGEQWKRQRKETAPVFSGGQFGEMADQMAEATSAMLDRWEPRVKRGDPIDVTLEMMGLALDVLLRTLFHEARDNIAGQMQKTLGVLLGEAEGRIWAPFSLAQSLIYRLPKYKRELKFLDDLVQELTTARLENKAYPDDLLSRLVDGYSTSKEDTGILRDMVMSFLLAGHETTAHSLSWSLYLLGQNPTQRQRLIDEVGQVLGNETPNLDAAKDLHYTRQVFEEALRLYPPVWTMSRQAIENDVIPLDNGTTVNVPKGAVTMLCGYTVQRNPRYWHDPEAFDPDRFTREEVAKRPQFAWFPFGGGQRVCLGNRFAQIESVIALAMITQRYKLTLLPGQNVTPKPIITLRPNGPILFQVEKRTTYTKTAATQRTPHTTTEDTLTEASLDNAAPLSPASQAPSPPPQCPFHHGKGPSAGPTGPA